MVSPLCRVTSAPWQASGPGSRLPISMSRFLSESAAQPALNSTFCHSAADNVTSWKLFVLANGFQAHAGAARRLAAQAI